MNTEQRTEDSISDHIIVRHQNTGIVARIYIISNTIEPVNVHRFTCTVGRYGGVFAVSAKPRIEMANGMASNYVSYLVHVHRYQFLRLKLTSWEIASLIPKGAANPVKKVSKRYECLG